MSDDGSFIHKLSSPGHHIPKVYEVVTHVPVTPELAAVSYRILAPHQLEIVLKQGKYHQVKRMLAAAGNHCVALRRSRIGGLKLAALGLAEGEWCYPEAMQLALLAPV